MLWRFSFYYSVILLLRAPEEFPVVRVFVSPSSIRRVSTFSLSNLYIYIYIRATVRALSDPHPSTHTAKGMHGWLDATNCRNYFAGTMDDTPYRYQCRWLSIFFFSLVSFPIFCIELVSANKRRKLCDGICERHPTKATKIFIADMESSEANVVARNYPSRPCDQNKQMRLAQYEL